MDFQIGLFPRNNAANTEQQRDALTSGIWSVSFLHSIITFPFLEPDRDIPGTAKPGWSHPLRLRCFWGSIPGLINGAFSKRAVIAGLR